LPDTGKLPIIFLKNISNKKMGYSYGTNIGTAGFEYTGTGVENHPGNIFVSTGDSFPGKGS
jgi:hypothetical protein